MDEKCFINKGTDRINMQTLKLVAIGWTKGAIDSTLLSFFFFTFQCHKEWKNNFFMHKIVFILTKPNFFLFRWAHIFVKSQINHNFVIDFKQVTLEPKTKLLLLMNKHK